MHELEMPLARAGLQIDADEAFGEEIVAGPVAAVEVGRWRLDRQIDEAELFVDGDLRPHADVAVGGPRLVLPRVVAELAGLGIVSNCQSFFPVRTSNARTSPLVLSCVSTVAPSRIADPTMAMSRTMMGVE